ncbi:MAG: hypothetical protein HFE44_11590 [Oscillospiraceae bacterium]|jgi:protein AbiQ|nr:hypothetical protein [Oscillospiraceae bacterium]
MTFIFLSASFFQDYANCPEIEQKANRPYICTYIEVNGISFAIPLRSHINHPHVLWTDKENHCGLDFSKTVVLTKPSYIDANKKPHIRQNEFDALRGKDYLIQQRLLKYISAYKKAKERLDVPRNQILCSCSTLQYFESYI